MLFLILQNSQLVSIKKYKKVYFSILFYRIEFFLLKNKIVSNKQMSKVQLLSNGMYVDSAFQAILKNKPCFLIWRVEHMQLTVVPKDSYGTFFKGDTYLVYSSTDSLGKSATQHIHLWIGADSTTVKTHIYITEI